jgi:U3 small nucleolar RNA-associated protein 13
VMLEGSCRYEFLNVISMVRFHPDSSRLLLFAADDRYEIRAWSLESSSCVGVLRGHYSAVTAIEFTSDGDEMYR